jgi:hypothetical protein
VQDEFEYAVSVGHAEFDAVRPSKGRSAVRKCGSSIANSTCRLRSPEQGVHPRDMCLEDRDEIFIARHRLVSEMVGRAINAKHETFRERPSDDVARKPFILGFVSAE